MHAHTTNRWNHLGRAAGWLLPGLLLWLYATSLAAAGQGVSLTVKVSNVDHKGGPCIVTLYDSPGTFLDVPAAEKSVMPDANGVAVARFDNLAPGQYAVTVIHDRNSNGKLDQGLFGIPKEPYAFSRGYRPRFRAPHFDEVQFDVAPPATAIEIALP